MNQSSVISLYYIQCCIYSNVVLLINCFGMSLALSTNCGNEEVKVKKTSVDKLRFMNLSISLDQTCDSGLDWVSVSLLNWKKRHQTLRISLVRRFAPVRWTDTAVINLKKSILFSDLIVISWSWLEQRESFPGCIV